MTQRARKKNVARKQQTASPTRSQTQLRETRRHNPDRSPKDQRYPFSRDRDRVLYSTALRRLAGVTQVVHAAQGHIFHNRLTHSLKVAQIGRRIVEFLRRTESDELIEAVNGIDPEVVETAALSHDLGHPPFGHIAETALDKFLKDNDINDGFEGNAQSFRIVTKVAIRAGDHRGLNLTRASLNAILKYPWGRGTAGKESIKWGYYFSEKEDFAFARESFALGDKRQSAEAAIMDWSDDVTYSVHDVDDFYRAGLIPLDQILAGTEERDRFIIRALSRLNREPQFKSLRADWANRFFDRLNLLTKDFDLDNPYIGNRIQRAGLDFLSAFLIKRYVLGDPDGGMQALRLIDSQGKPFLDINSNLEAEVNLLKELMSFYVFDNPALVAQQYGQRQVVSKLLEILFEAAQPPSKNRGIIPQPYCDYLNELATSDSLERARIVADIVASMTEQQSLLFHQRLMGFAPGSVRDLTIG